MSLRACGIVFCYNEEHILPYCLQHYLLQGIDLVVFDNYSTDSSLSIIEETQKKNGTFAGEIKEIVRIKTQGYEWKKILEAACEFMHQRLSGYDWILLIDSDAFYYSPVRKMTLLEFMAINQQKGYNIIEGRVRDFYPTEKDDPAVISPVSRIKYCRLSPYLLEQKIFLYHPSIDFYSSFGHACLRQSPRVSVARFLYNHYPWVSFEHGLKKIFKERRPRYVERPSNPPAHSHYLEMLPIKQDLIKKADTLRFFALEKNQISRTRLTIYFQMSLFLRLFYKLRKMIALLRSDYLLYLWNIFLYAKDLEFKYVFDYLVKRIQTANRPYKGNYIWRSISKSEILQQKIFVMGLPGVYHFLLTNYCNARCVFCNQSERGPEKEITLDKFKTMLSHIPMDIESTFYFSGGGEPLLCRDFFPILEYMKVHHPIVKILVRTNGLLIGKFVEQLSASGIHQLEISVHAATEDTNKLISQKGDLEQTFTGISLLNTALGKQKQKMKKVFFCVVSQLNVEEVPELVKKAAALEIDEILITFCRYYPVSPSVGNSRMSSETSLYFDQGKYNTIMLRAKKIARESGVAFSHEPLFFQNSLKKQPCLQPWKNIVIDWDGDIYPCTGGETWFGNKVKSGQYRFGNLLNEHLVHSWNSIPYIMIRRTCNRRLKESFIPECEDCHNLICLEGPDAKQGHILVNKGLTYA